MKQKGITYSVSTGYDIGNRKQIHCCLFNIFNMRDPLHTLHTYIYNTFKCAVNIELLQRRRIVVVVSAAIIQQRVKLLYIIIYIC